MATTDFPSDLQSAARNLIWMTNVPLDMLMVLYFGFSLILFRILFS